MSNLILKMISEIMESLSIPYAFMEWNAAEIPLTYFTGEYIETESSTLEESGFQQYSFILNGFTRGNWLELETAKKKIKNAIARTAILEDGTGVAIFYKTAQVIATNDASFKRIKIDLSVQEWRV